MIKLQLDDVSRNSSLIQVHKILLDIGANLSPYQQWILLLDHLGMMQNATQYTHYATSIHKTFVTAIA